MSSLLPRNLRLSLFSATLAAAVFAPHAPAAPATISVQVDQPAHKISPMLWGLFFEDINLSVDSGLYPELVRNSSFEGSDHLRYWKFTPAPGESGPSLDDSKPLNAFNRHSLHVRPGSGTVLLNSGFWGMNFVAGETYRFSLAARVADNAKGKIKVELLDSADAVVASGQIDPSADSVWKVHGLTLVPAKSDPRGKLCLTLDGGGSVFLDMISLQPERTWKRSGVRPDLGEALHALKPAFFRFPGGCFVEGDYLADAYQWKYTLGDVASRTPQENVWDYLSTHGLGYHEYLQLSEDLGTEPVFCINVGMAHLESVPLDRIGPYIQDALDAIEYANGPVDSVWGALRAKNGHPEPFNLRYLEIGNENGGPDYLERWPLFVKAVKARYPDMILIANRWYNAFPKDPMPAIVDEHYYETPESFMRMSTQYDSYDRAGPKIFVGEYAVTKRAGHGNLRAALGEAAFMTGFERNADVVTMAAYAPILTNVNHRAWNPNLIVFDSARWYGIPSYYTQQMFSENAGDVTLPITVTSAELSQPEAHGRVGLGTWNSSAEFKDMKVTAPDGTVLYESDFAKKGLEGWSFAGPGEWQVVDGVLRQSVEKPKIRAMVGDTAWKDYDIQVKARKLSGREGFLVLFHLRHEEDRTGWNLGGWDNKYFNVGLDDSQDRVSGTIEAGQWHDLKVELRGGHVRCWLDGKLIHDHHSPELKIKSLYASATRDTATGDIIVKVVNAAEYPTETTINLSGAGNLSGQARAIVLTSENPADENSFDAPRKVAPRTEEITITGPRFTRSFPGNSLTVLRIPVTKQVHATTYP
ncbi:MAG: alpha-L-arabinofuranosidase C-terminal domain-containing protein [Rariglobus sp.]